MPGKPDVEELARAIAATQDNPDGTVETRSGEVSTLDYPEEWYMTPRELAILILEEWDLANAG